MKSFVALLFFFNICHCSQEINIIELKSDDFLLYKKLRIESAKEFPEAFGSTYEEELKLSDESWKCRLKLNMLFAKKDSQIIGMIGSVIDPREKVKHSAHIISFYVLPKFRGFKAGFLLINTLINKLKNEKKIKRFTLHVTSTQTKAIELYKQLGFVITGNLRHEYYVNNTYYDQYLMTLSFIEQQE